MFVKWPTGHECQLWVDEATDKMYYYDMSQWLEYTQSAWNDGRTYWPTWKVVDSDDEMWVYDTNEPTDLFVWESGDKVSYVFKDWDGTVLKEGKVNEWTKPTAPADPTRAATAQYTYTFAWWNPEVAKITKKTTYTATYTSTVNQYTVTFVDEDGTTELDEQTLDYWATPVYAGETPTKTGYTFSWWTPAIATVTWDATYTATYEADSFTVTFTPNDATYGSVSPASVTADYGTSITFSNDEPMNIVHIWETTVTATAEDGYEFINYQLSGWDPIPATVTGDLNVEVIFDVYSPWE